MKKWNFKRVFLIYVGVLAVLVAGATAYVNSLLKDYENAQPTVHAAAAVEELSAKAADGSLWDTYSLPAKGGELEAHLDLKNTCAAILANEELALVQAAAGEDTITYHAVKDGFPVAEVTLKAAGPMVTKLAVFSSREWAVESVKLLVEARDYTITLPEKINLNVNGIDLTAADGTEKNGEVTYTLGGLFLAPEITLTDAEGAEGTFSVRDGKIVPKLYRYAMTLPAALAVEVDGSIHSGEALDDGRVRHDIVRLAKPVVMIRDLYGNEAEYTGGSSLPLTYMTVTAEEGAGVTVEGAAVPAAAVTTMENPAYERFAQYVKALPKLQVYDIAVLKADAAVSITDAAGMAVQVEEGKTSYDLTAVNTGAAMPADLASEVDVLDIAQKWSLFMSNDLRFSKVEPYLISGSYQHDVARKYATGIDITFVSNHVLLDPAFTDNTVTNFRRLGEDCFSVDVHFVKNMLLARGNTVEDEFNDRLYFVRYDDTNNNVDDPTWKLANMQEVVKDAD